MPYIPPEVVERAREMDLLLADHVLREANHFIRILES